MGRIYRQLSLEERVEIYHLLGSGCSLRAIARSLERSVGTISREVVRNGQRTFKRAGVYCAAAAHRRAVGRRHRDKRFKLERQPALRARVKDGLAMGWSPAQIAGRLAHEQGEQIISHESIYRYIYHRSSDSYKDYWHRWLPQRKHRRGPMQRGQPRHLPHLKDRVSIHARSEEINTRQSAGHWEIDMMLFSHTGQNILVSCERTTRFIYISRTKDRTAQRIANRLCTQFAALPQSLTRSATFDNGTEFADHTDLHAHNIKTYFCDIRAPWQKGSVENAIGRLRRWLPRKTNLNTLSIKDIQHAADLYNNTPRKCLHFQTPNEVFKKHISTVALQT